MSMDKNEKPAATTPISTQLAVTPISHFMTRTVVYATATTTVHTAMKMMISHKISGLVIVDKTEACVGVYSEFDAMLQGSTDPLSSVINYSKSPKTVRAETPFRDVLVLLAKGRIKRAPVVDEHNRILGIISRRDLMKAIFDDHEFHTAK